MTLLITKPLRLFIMIVFLCQCARQMLKLSLHKDPVEEVELSRKTISDIILKVFTVTKSILTPPQRLFLTPSQKSILTPSQNLF